MKGTRAILTAALVIIFYVSAGHVAVAFPLPTIDNPCMTDPKAQPELSPIIDLLKSAITQANAAMASCQALMDKIKTDALLTSSEFNDIIQIGYSLSGLPYRQESTNVSVSNVPSLLKQHFNDISIHILYQQAAILDQIAYDNGKYLTQLQNVQSNFYSSLCKANLLVRSVNSSITQYLDSSVVPSSLKNMSDDKRRYKRNLILINQGKLLLTVQIANYAKMIEAQSTVG